jgi:hypothetical protein
VLILSSTNTFLAPSAAASPSSRSTAVFGIPLTHCEKSRVSGTTRFALGSFHTKRRRGGVHRRQLELKGVEGGD